MMVKGRVTIDTRPPFRSVKEAVALFGEKLLASLARFMPRNQVKDYYSNEDDVSKVLTGTFSNSVMSNKILFHWCLWSSSPLGYLKNELICGRPLGLRFTKKTGDLYIADANFGLMKVGPKEVLQYH